MLLTWPVNENSEQPSRQPFLFNAIPVQYGRRIRIGETIQFVHAICLFSETEEIWPATANHLLKGSIDAHRLFVVQSMQTRSNRVSGPARRAEGCGAPELIWHRTLYCLIIFNLLVALVNINQTNTNIWGIMWAGLVMWLLNERVAYLIFRFSPKLDMQINEDRYTKNVLRCGASWRSSVQTCTLQNREFATSSTVWLGTKPPSWNIGLAAGLILPLEQSIEFYSKT